MAGCRSKRRQSDGDNGGQRTTSWDVLRGCYAVEAYLRSKEEDR